MAVLYAEDDRTLFSPATLNPAPGPPGHRYGVTASAVIAVGYAAGMAGTAVGQIESSGSVLLCREYIWFKIKDTPANVTKAFLRFARATPLATELDIYTNQGFEVHPRGVPITGRYPVVIDALGNVPPMTNNFETDPDTPTMAAEHLTYWNKPALLTSAEVIQVTDPPKLYILDIKAQYNAAKALGHSYFTIRLRETTETLVGDYTQVQWHFMGTIESFPPDARPAFTDDDGKLYVVPGRAALVFSVLEPCIFLKGTVLSTLPERADFKKGYGKNAITAVRRGNILRITVSLVDHKDVPAKYVNGTAYLTLTSRDGTVVVNHQQMGRIDRGTYIYDYQTKDTDPVNQLYAAELEVDPLSITP